MLRTDPDNADALYYVAVVACQEGQYKEGVALARRALEHRRRQPRACTISSARRCSGSGRARWRRSRASTRAIALRAEFRRAARQPRHSAGGELGLPEEALKGFERALELDPKAVADWINRGALLVDLGRLDEAIASFDRAIALAPQSLPALLNRADALRAAGRPQEALDAYERVLALAPGMAEVQVGRAITLKELGRLDQALSATELALAAKPKLAPAHRLRGAVLQALGRAAEAEKSLAKAAEIEAQTGETGPA